MTPTLSYALVRAYHHNSQGKQSLWAVATDKRGRILAEAGNSYHTTHPEQARWAKSVGRDKAVCLHAEVAVLVKLLKKKVDTSRVRLYIARSNTRGEAMLAKPCVICEAAIKASGIKYVEWTGEN